MLREVPDICSPDIGDQHRCDLVCFMMARVSGCHDMHLEKVTLCNIANKTFGRNSKMRNNAQHLKLSTCLGGRGSPMSHHLLRRLPTTIGCLNRPQRCAALMSEQLGLQPPLTPMRTTCTHTHTQKKLFVVVWLLPAYDVLFVLLRHSPKVGWHDILLTASRRLTFRIPIRHPTLTSDDFPSASGWETEILSKENWFPLVRERKSWKLQWEQLLPRPGSPS